jgi:formylglycine-generating enzyme required for sulfatase activity
MLLTWGLATHNASALITIDTVYVGDIGNPSDWTGRGAVDYGYSIGKDEVTVGQYVGFLNAVAKADPYALYNPIMGYSGDISRSGVSGVYTYKVVGNASKPITEVSWFDAARFVNWLHNGQPTGAQGSGTTETGAYTLNGALTGVNFTKNAGAQYWIPSDNEWYKAAYYQPAAQGGDSDSYWLYPTRSNTQPNSRNGSVTDPNSANYYYNDGIANGYNGGYAINNSTTEPYDGRTVVGAFSQAYSFYGTFDQGGNVFEWDDFVSGDSRAIVGGSWTATMEAMQAVNYYNVSDPSSEFGNVGFRIAAVPEPSSLALLGGFILVSGCFLRRKR